MTANDISQRVSKLSQRLEELQAKCTNNPEYVPEVLEDALESLRAGLEELSAADKELMQQNEELIKAHSVLQVSEEKFRLVADFTYDWETWKDPNGNYVYVSPSCERITGYSAEEFIKNPSLSVDIVHPDDKENLKQHELVYFNEQIGGSQIDYRIITAKRETRWISHMCQPVFGKNGEWLGRRASNRDITERKQAVEERAAELDEQHGRLQAAYNRSLIEASLDPLVTIGPDGSITDVNAATEAVTGYSREELIGADFSDYFTEPHKARAGYQQVFKEGFVRDYALEIQHHDGHITPVLYNASVYRNDAGEIIGVFAAARDVTAQKQASQYARSLIESSLDPLVTISADGKITDVNEATIKATGIPRDQIIGTDFSNYFTEPEKAREGYQQVFEKGFVTDYPLTIRHRDGRLTDVLYNASVYKDIHDNVIGVFAAARDITKRRQAEIELDNYRKHLEDLVQARTSDLKATNAKLHAEIAERERAEGELRTQAKMMDLANILVMDMDGKIIYWNKGAHEQYGFTKEEAIGTSSHQLLQTKSIQPLAEIEAETIQEGHWEGELTHVKHDGTPVTVASHWVLYRDSQGKPALIIEVNNDITERKLAEEALKKARDELEQRVQERTAELVKTNEDLMAAKVAAEAAVEAKSAFLMNMSHELRTPLNAVIGFSSLLLTDNLTQDQKEYIERIRNGGEALLSLISDILEFSRAEKEKVELELQPLSLKHCFEESMGMVAVQAEQKGLNLSYTIRYGTPDTIIGDPGRLRQILVNLLSNAVKFTDVGDIFVSVSSQVIEGNKRQIQFAVKDTGIGMPQDKMDRLFQPFTQLEYTLSRKRDGAGLGLSICKKLVELMGGKIWAESEEGKGSTFRFMILAETLPDKQLDLREKEIAAVYEDLSARKPLSILVADDNPSNQRVLVDMLKRLGYRADAVADGTEVLQALQIRPYDLVFMDLRMSEMDGIAATKEIRKQWPDNGPKVIAITAFAMDKDRAMCLEAGMDDYIAKPVKVDDLVTLLRNIAPPPQRIKFKR